LAVLAAASCQPTIDRITAAVDAERSINGGNAADVTELLPSDAGRAKAELIKIGYEPIARRPSPPASYVGPLLVAESFPDIASADGAVGRMHFTREISDREMSVRYAVIVDVGAEDVVLRATGLVLFTVVS